MFYFGSLSTDMLCLSAIIIVSIVSYFYYCFLYWKQRGVPYITPSFPFGNIKDILFIRKSFGVTMQDFYLQLKTRGVKFGGIYLFTKPGLVVLDPELIKPILTKDFQHFHDRVQSVNREDNPLAHHLFTQTGSRWSILRKKITPTFASGKIKNMFKSMLACGEELEAALEHPAKSAKPVDIKDLLARYTTDVVGSCVFGLNCNSFKDTESEFYQYGKLFMNTTLTNNVRLIVGMAFLKILKLFKIKWSNIKVSDFFLNTLKKYIQHREDNNIHQNDFVELFVKMKNNKNIDDNVTPDDNDPMNNKDKGITFNELASQAFIIWIAGFENASTTLSFCLYELSLQPSIQDELRAEILNELKKNDGDLTYSSIMNMEYLDKVIKGK